MRPTNIMHMIDALVHGGAERAAINIANLLPRDRYTSHLCTTRAEGAQADLIDSHVKRLQLCRHGRFDVGPLRRLIKYIRRNEIDIIHAHTSSLFVARVAAGFWPYPAIVWHVHNGRDADEDRSSLPYRLAARKAAFVIAVSQPLAEWLERRIQIPNHRIKYLENFVSDSDDGRAIPDLPGEAGARIVNVANFRSQKDQITLIRAMVLVRRKVPNAHLMLIGATNDPGYLAEIKNEILINRLEESVTVLGERTDVASILRQCDIGVLSSTSEGLPIALLEYGAAGLAAVATDVGECGYVLDFGRAGKLVPPSNSEKLASSLVSFLVSAEERATFGERLKLRVSQQYGAEQGIRKVCEIYTNALKFRRSSRQPTDEEENGEKSLRLQSPFRGQ